MESSEYVPSLFQSHWRSTPNVVVQSTKPDPDKYNILSFLASAQALRVPFLPIFVDAALGLVGAGGTSTVRQSPVTLSTSLAFKHFRNHDHTEEQIFRTLVNELTVLCQKFVREHAQIAQLQGICWDVSSDDDRPWPMLVFEKSHYGDLYSFAAHEGTQMTMEERLGLCVDIGRATLDMHSNHIVHGDIKPSNVLVFKDEAGRYNAKVIDFGYSVFWTQPDQQLRLPRSEPWNAPENDGRRAMWTFSQAVKTDLFCFGVLCFWLLFEPRISNMVHDSADSRGRRHASAEHSLYRMKQDMRTHARQLLASTPDVEKTRRMVLDDFFDSSLSPDPNERTGSLSGFLAGFGAQQITAEQVSMGNIEFDMKLADDFKIEISMSDLYRSDYRLRLHLVQEILSRQTQSMSFALQAAFCYHIGFGVKRNESLSKRILDQYNQNMGTIQEMMACSQSSTLDTDLTFELTEAGHMRWSSFIDTYMVQGKLFEAEKQLFREKEDLFSAYGRETSVSMTLRSALSAIYGAQGRWLEAEEEELQSLEWAKSRFSDDCTLVAQSLRALANTISSQGRYNEAEQLLAQAIDINNTLLGPEHSNTMSSADELADMLLEGNPHGLVRAFFVGSGSEATDSALKLARQYYVEDNQPARQQIVARRRAFDGNTIGALSVGSHVARRGPYEDALLLGDNIVSFVSPTYFSVGLLELQGFVSKQNPPGITVLASIGA